MKSAMIAGAITLALLCPGATWAARTVGMRVNPKDGAVMVRVPAGPFWMGSRAGRGFSDEQPAKKVTLGEYWIYRTEVTVAQYRRFCRETGRQMPKPPVYGWKANAPITNISWYDALEYCKWAGVTLPTEAQWEKAARGTDGREYPWGNEFNSWRPKLANTAEYWKLYKTSTGNNSLIYETAPVGSFPFNRSPYGALDMAGNAAEWCADWYHPDTYGKMATKDPAGPKSGVHRVVRGGSVGFEGDNSFARAAYRWHCHPAGSMDRVIGFRPVWYVGVKPGGISSDLLPTYKRPAGAVASAPAAGGGGAPAATMPGGGPMGYSGPPAGGTGGGGPAPMGGGGALPGYMPPPGGAGGGGPAPLGGGPPPGYRPPGQ